MDFAGYKEYKYFKKIIAVALYFIYLHWHRQMLTTQYRHNDEGKQFQVSRMLFTKSQYRHKYDEFIVSSGTHRGKTNVGLRRIR